jgi:pyrimidine operon attenuation protein/uracil phosphoribosyltransferase
MTKNESITSASKEIPKKKLRAAWRAISSTARALAISLALVVDRSGDVGSHPAGEHFAVGKIPAKRQDVLLDR